MLKYQSITKYISVAFLSLFILIAFASCEKVIDVKLDTSASQLVIEGNITDVLAVQTVTLAESVPYTNSNTYPPVTGAQVVVTDNAGNSWTLRESKPGTYVTQVSMRGIAGRRYTLRVVSKNTTYTAAATMPARVRLDALSTKIISLSGDDLKIVEVHFKDPVDRANYYRWVMKVNGVQIKAVFADNDRLTNGNDVVNPLFYDDDTNEELKTDDAVEVEMQCIDKDVFTYWYTLSQQTQNGPGGGVTPGNPPSNIDNNALGYFSVHTTQKRTMKVQ